MVQNNSQSKARTSVVTDPLQHFLERIDFDALEEHDEKVNESGRNITTLRSADNIDALAEEECTRYKISAEKTKLMTNNAIVIHSEIKV